MAKSIPKTIRMSPEEVAQIEAHAAKMNVTFSEYVKSKALEPPLPLEVWARLKESADSAKRPLSWLINRILILFDVNSRVTDELGTYIDGTPPLIGTYRNLDTRKFASYVYWRVSTLERRELLDYIASKFEQDKDGDLTPSEFDFLSRLFPGGYSREDVLNSPLTSRNICKRIRSLQEDGEIPKDIPMLKYFSEASIASRAERYFHGDLELDEFIQSLRDIGAVKGHVALALAASNVET